MKKCPYCAEEIQDEAIVCRYCNKELTKDAVIGVYRGGPGYGMLSPYKIFLNNKFSAKISTIGGHKEIPVKPGFYTVEIKSEFQTSEIVEFTVEENQRAILYTGYKGVTMGGLFFRSVFTPKESIFLHLERIELIDEM